MNRTKFAIVVIVAAGSLAAASGPVFAQSDKTMGINCTVAGHVHCGENGRAWGGVRHWHHSRHAYRSHHHETQRQVIRDNPQDHARTGAVQTQPTPSSAQGQTKPETQGRGDPD
jgi:hypothetical protein